MTQTRAQVEREYERAIAEASKLRGGNAVRRAARKAADDRLREALREVAE